MEILSSLGIDHTALLQFAVFATAFFVMTFGLFGPYAKAFELREERTQGGEAAAEDLVKKTQDLRSEFETKARANSSEIKSIFDAARETAQKEFDHIVSGAREQSQTLVEQARAKVSAQLSEAQRKLKEEVPAIAQAITSKLLSKKV